MSDLFGIAAIESVSLAIATTKTVLQITAPTNHRVKVIGYGVFFNGTTAGATPVRVRLLRQTTAGTMSSLTPLKTQPRAESLLTTALHTATGTEPSASDIVEAIFCHPQQGYEVRFPQGQEIVLEGGGRLGLECNAPAAVAVTAKLIFEE